MSVVPNTKVGKIEFSENHITPWTAHATAIGTTSAALTDLGTKTTAARAAYQAQQAAQEAARNATNDLNIAVAAMNTAVVDIIKQIRAKAATAGDGVYSLASIPVPATPSPKAPPGTPEALKVTLDGDGALNLTWKCVNPPGTMGTIYQIWRRIGPPSAGDFIYIGGAGEKKFTDTTLPAGSTSVTYQIQGVRSTTVGQWAQFNVNFGTSSGGGMTASVTQTPPSPRIAA